MRGRRAGERQRRPARSCPANLPCRLRPLPVHVRALGGPRLRHGSRRQRRRGASPDGQAHMPTRTAGGEARRPAERGPRPRPRPTAETSRTGGRRGSDRGAPAEPTRAVCQAPARPVTRPGPRRSRPAAGRDGPQGRDEPQGRDGPQGRTCPRRGSDRGGHPRWASAAAGRARTAGRRRWEADRQGALVGAARAGAVVWCARAVGSARVEAGDGEPARGLRGVPVSIVTGPLRRPWRAGGRGAGRWGGAGSCPGCQCGGPQWSASDPVTRFSKSEPKWRVGVDGAGAHEPERAERGRPAETGMSAP